MVADSDRTVALVTGAGSGIGRACAVELARRGLATVGTVRGPAEAESLKSAAASAGVNVDVDDLDITDAEHCAEVVDRWAPDILVSVAGYALSGAMAMISDQEARDQLEALVVAPLRLARLALPEMVRRGGGRIVMVGSLLGRISIPLLGWYVAGKHALEGACDALRVEVASSGVRVSIVEPGAIYTPIYADTRRQLELRVERGDQYAGAYRRWGRLTRSSETRFNPAEAVAAAVARACVEPRPKSRYLVGPDAAFLARAYPLTPPPARDLMLRLLFGLYGHGRRGLSPQPRIPRR